MAGARLARPAPLRHSAALTEKPCFFIVAIVWDWVEDSTWDSEPEPPVDCRSRPPSG